MKKFISAVLSLVMVLGLVGVPVLADETAGGGSEQITLPAAIVTDLDVNEISDVELTYALNFKVDETTAAEFENLAEWYADFELTVNKDVTLDASEGSDCYLAGQYDSWSDSWVTVPIEGTYAITANEPVKIMATAAEIMGESGLKYTCGEVYEFVKDFDCGIYFSDRFLAQNPDLKVTLELRIYNNEDESENYVIGGNTYEFTAVELPVATVTELDTKALAADGENPVELTYGLKFKADEATEEQVAAYGDWYVDFVLTVDKNVDFIAGGDGTTNYLAGSYKNWSEGAWVKVPTETVAVEAGTSVKIMEMAAEMLGKDSLKYTYSEVFEVVDEFDCGVYFTPEFLEANKDLKVTLELRIYHPEAEEVNYTIGEAHSFERKETTNDNVVIQGTNSTAGNSVTLEKVDIVANPGTETITIDTTQIATEENAVVNTVTIPATTITDVNALGYNAELNIELANGENENITVSINKEALEAIQNDIATNDSTASSLTLKVEETDDLTLSQDNVVDDLHNEVVYKIVLETENGTEIYTTPDTDSERKIVINIYYEKSNTLGDIVVKHLTDAGELEDVKFDYNETTKMITMELAHFSEYVIHQEEIGQSGVSGGSGGGTTGKVTVTFNTNGGSLVDVQKVEKGDKAVVPEEPVKKGYKFDGWYTDKSLTKAFDFETEIKKTTTLYAKWVKVDAEGNPIVDTPVVPGEDAETKVWFEDVKDNAWYYDDVKYAFDNGFMNGVTEKTFAPDEKLTRAMFVTILYRAEGSPAVNKSIPFGDLEHGFYYENAVIWAQQNKIINGVTETEFAPNQSITREQIAAIMFRFAEYKGYDITAGENVQIANYDDFGSINDYAISAVKYAIGSGLMKGRTDRTINPRDNATRAEIATIIRRFITANEAENATEVEDVTEQ